MEYLYEKSNNNGRLTENMSNTRAIVLPENYL